MYTVDGRLDGQEQVGEQMEDNTDTHWSDAGSGGLVGPPMDSPIPCSGADRLRETLKDLGKIVAPLQISTQPVTAVKHDGGKRYRMELLSVPALQAISEVLGFGASKYDRHNWRNGFEWSRLYGAALRHLTAHMSGENLDPESGLSHLAHAGCCLMFLLEHEICELGTDDRYITK